MKINQPSGAGPFPTVILMHWTGGPGKAERTWSKHLNAAGFATVTLKSYSQIKGSFASYEKRVPERVKHLQLAYASVAKKPWSNGKISVLGRSHGAWAVIDALKAGALRSKLYRAVASAPHCEGQRSASTKIKSRTPLLIVNGSKDRVVNPKACAAFYHAAKKSKKSLYLAEFPTGHSVDLKSKAATQAIIKFLH